VRQQDSSTPAIARIEKVMPRKRKLLISWVYRPCELLHSDPHQHRRCRNEVFIALGHTDEIQLESVEDRAILTEHIPGRCGGNFTTAPWCWRQYYNVVTGAFVGKLDHDSASSVQVI
jgi:hypothetical protein